MSEAGEQMLAERDEEIARKLDRKWDSLGEQVMAMIDRAAPFMDEDSDPKKWSPSAKLKIYFLVAATSQSKDAERQAMLHVLKMLDEARKLWIEGFIPDPWVDVPRKRA